MEGGIFSGESLQSLHQQLTVLLILYGDGKRNYGFGYVKRIDLTLQSSFGESFTRSAVNTSDSANVSSSYALDFLHLAGVHTDELRYLDLGVLGGIVDGSTLLEFTLVDTKPCQLAGLVFLQLEGKAE